MTYKSNSDFSAVLLTTYPVTKERYIQDAGMDQWVLENASLIEKYDDVKTYGLWIVTQTYSTPACAINVSTAMGSEIVVSFDAKAPVVAGASANTKWYTDRRDTNWRYMDEQVCRSLIPADHITGEEVRRLYCGPPLQIHAEIQPTSRPRGNPK